MAIERYEEMQEMMVAGDTDERVQHILESCASDRRTPTEKFGREPGTVGWRDRFAWPLDRCVGSRGARCVGTLFPSR